MGLESAPRMSVITIVQRGAGTLAWRGVSLLRRWIARHIAGGKTLMIDA